MSVIEQKLAAIAGLEAEFGSDDLKVADALEELALWYAENRIYSGALPYFRRSLAIREAKLGADVAVAGALERWARCADRKGKPEATELFERSLAMRQNASGPESPDLLPVLDALAERHRRGFQFAAALSCQTRALAIAEQAYGPVTSEIAERLLRIGQHHLAMKDHAAAEPPLRRALAIHSEIGAPDDAQLSQALTGLIRSLAATQRPEEIASLLQRSLRIRATQLAGDAAGLVEALADAAEAVAVYGRVEDLTSLLPEGPAAVWPATVSLLLHLGRQLILNGRRTEAGDVVALAVNVLEHVLTLPDDHRRPALHALLEIDPDLAEEMSRQPDPEDGRLAEALAWLAANPGEISGRRPLSILG